MTDKSTPGSAARLVCAKCGAKSDHPGICWACFDREALTAKARDERARNSE